MNYRQIVNLLATFFVIIIIFNIPVEKAWLNKRILVFNKDFYDEIERMDLESRRVRRWASSYTAMVSISDYIKKNQTPDVLVLVPPDEFYKKRMPWLILPEPVVAYYFTGLRTTTKDCDDVLDAKGCILYRTDRFEYQPLEGQDEVRKVLELYEKN